MTDSTDAHGALSRREREKAMHRQDIIQAAIAVFSEKGFYASTLDEIAQRAEFSKGALYLYFQNKEDLLFTILVEPLQGWLDACTTIMVGDKPFREELARLFKETGAFIFENPRLFALINAQDAALFKALSDENRQMVLAIKTGIREKLRERIEQALANKEIRLIATEALIGMIQGSMGSMVFCHWGCETSEELNKKIDVFIDMIFNGIAFGKE